MTIRAAVERCYGAAVRLYPRRFRDEYGPDLELLFREQCEDESVWRVTARTGLDLALTIPTQHLEARMNTDSTTPVSLLFAVLATGGLLLAVVGGTSGPTSILGLGLAFVFGLLAVIAWRRAAPPPVRTTSRSWWMLLVGGLALIGLVIAAAGAGVEAWYLGMASVLTGMVLVVIGIAFGLVHVATRHRSDRHLA